MNLRGWFSEQFGGIKEGLEKKSFVAAVIRGQDRKIGRRGAFGRRRAAFQTDTTVAHNAARGPRLHTWWKQQRKAK